MRDDDLAYFAPADSLLARVEQHPWGLTGTERLELLTRAREALAKAMDSTPEDAGRAMHEAGLHGDLKVQSGDQFAIVTCWGRLLTVAARAELRGVCHPDLN